MAKQVSEILVKLGIQGAEGLDKLKSSFRELEKAIGPSNATIEKARRSIVEFGEASGRTEQLIRGQLEAFKGLRSQAEIGSATYGKLVNSIAQLETELKGSTAAIEKQREAILRSTSSSEKSAQAFQQQINALKQLQQQTRPGSSAFAQLGKDIDTARGKLTGLASEAQEFSRALNQGFGATPEKLSGQIAALRRGMVSLRFDSEKYLETLERIRLMTITQAGRTGRAEVIAGFQAYQNPTFTGGYASPGRLPDLPNTTAALEQQLSELTAELANVERGSARYVNVSNQMAGIQRQLRNELTGTAEAFRRLDIAQTGVERRADKIAGIQEYYRTQGPMAPGVGGFRDPATGAIIAAGARTPGRIQVEEAAYPTPIGPQAFPEAGKRAQEAIQRSLDDVNRIYEDARIRRVELQSKYDQIQIDKMLDGLDLEGRVREKGFKDELAAFDRQLEIRDRKRRGRLTTGQAVQSAGAIISGGIFGGPEGFLGGLGGFAAGLAIPGLGPVGGAFAGAAGGAQLGGLRQAAGAAAEYAAEIRRLQLALQGVVYSFEDYKSALGAIESASQQFNIPILQSTQQFTKLSAAVIGSGGTIKDAENTFKGLSASVLATGGSIQDVNGALVAAAQVFSKGKVSAEELRGQIGERLAGAFALFAESSDKSTKELDADLQAGEVTLAQFVQFVEFSLKKYGRTAQIIADSPEQAGARLDLALKNLQKNIGDALGPSGAAFQDFAARSIRGIDRLINKLIELKAIQPGAGFYQEQVLGKQMSIQELETALLEAGSRETALRKSVVPGLGFMADLLPGVKEATKEVKILEEALVKLRLIEKETNKEKKQRQDDEVKAEKEKLGQQYLQAAEQREEALLDARRQREEQIAKIRKDAVEQAAQIERQLGDERRQIERDIERTRREMEFGAGELDRLRRLAAGEDPEVIEAERKAAEIGQRASEDRIKVQEDLLNKEFEQKRTIADFQKNTAKQIAEANENYAKHIGEIQNNFAKASAKIIEEGSGNAAKRLTLAAQIVSQILQRTSLNQQRVQQFGLQPINEPSGFVGGRPVYGNLKPAEVPEQIKRIDQNLEQLLRKLSAPQGNQSSLPAFRASSGGIGEQFISLLQNEKGYEDVAGLLPLPIQRMQQQAARPLRMVWESIQDAMEGIYGATEKQIKRTFKPDPVRNQQVLQRIQKTQEAILNWNPLEAQWKETENQIREQKRSKASRMPISSFVAITKDIHQGMSEELRKAGALATRANERSFFDFSDFVSPQQQQILTIGIRESLSAAMDQSFSELRQLNGKAGNDPSATPSFSNAIQKLAPVINQFRGLFQQILSQEAASGHRYAQDAMKKFGMQAPVSEQFYRSLQYTQPGILQEQLEKLMEQPRIQPGIEGQFEGAILPGRGFNISRLTRNFGNIASASPGPLGLLAQAIQGAAPTSQLRQQGAQQQIQQINQNQLREQFGVLSEITQTSRDTYKTLQDQTREIELQIQYLNEGYEPAIAKELTTLQQSHETQKRRLQLQAQTLINQGENVEAVTQQYNLELQNLDTLNNQNKQLAIQNEQRNKAIQDAAQLKDAILNPLQQGLTQAFDLLINGTENWGNSLRQIGATILQDIARQLIQIYVINQAISAIGKLFPKPAANGMAFAQNGIQPFAMGGIVTKPTFFKYANGGTFGNGVMGEAGPEAIMPLKRGVDGKLGVAARLDGAMKRYRATPGSAAAAAEGDSASLAAAGATAMEPIDVRYSVERINNVDYVTADQFQAGMAQAAQQGAIQGERRAMRTLTNSAAARGRLRI